MNAEQKQRDSGTSHVLTLALLLVLLLPAVLVLYAHWAKGRVEDALGSLVSSAPKVDGHAVAAAPGSIVTLEGDTVGTISQIAGVRSETLPSDSTILFLATFTTSRARGRIAAESSLVAFAEHGRFWAGKTTIRLERDTTRAKRAEVGRLFFDVSAVPIPVVSVMTRAR
jgi:hypothetical protein